MPLDDFDFPEDFDWDEVDYVHVYRDDSGWEVWFEMSDGSIQEIDYTFDDDEAQDYIWDDLYWWAESEGIEFDREIDYSGE